MTTAMDTSAIPSNDATTAPQLQLDRDTGRTIIAVHGDELSPTDTAGWTTTGKHVQQRATQPVPGESTTDTTRTTTRASFAKRVTATLTKAARMPSTLPRDEIKIIMRPRGGLHTGRIEAPVLMSAIMVATGISKAEAMEDTVCTNVAQNIIVVSTPSEQRAGRYSQLRMLSIGGQAHEVHAYRAAPDGTVKGVIRNISVEDTPADLTANIVNPCNPLAIEAHRIGNSTSVIVLFAGQKVPNTVKYGSVLTKCSLYRQHYEICRQCGKVGHRTDVCPQPNVRVCFACGKANPGADHETECTPHCKLCGGPHPTGSPGCSNRYKMPYVVKRRQWEHKNAVTSQKQERKLPRMDAASFPPLSQPRDERERSRSRQRGRSGSRQRSASRRRSASSSRRKGQASCSRERVAWADVVRTPASVPAPKAAPKPAPQPAPMLPPTVHAEMTALRAENAQLRQQLAAINGKLTQLLAERQPPPPQPPTPTIPLSTENVGSEDDDNSPQNPRSPEPTPEPQPKRRAVESLRLRRITDRLDKIEDHSNRRLAALEHNVRTIQETLSQIQAFLHHHFAPENGPHNMPPLQATWPGPPQ